jgi:hypothetical protein
MGIKGMNRFLNDKCKRSSIGKKTLNVMRNRVIVVDTSIYMYKYSAQEALLENFYLMISLFREYNITPLFVFDGKPPCEKRELLRERQLLKKQAELKFKELAQELATTPNHEQKKELSAEMDCLKKQFVRIRDTDIASVKSLMTSYGVMYYEACGEADRICAHLVLSGKAWACLSDDMDMFIYGCPRVLRHMSLIHNTVLLYKMENILNDLNMDIHTFRQIGILSGTDYNIHQNTSLYETIRWYDDFTHKKTPSEIKEMEPKYGFYQWLNENTKYIMDIDQLIHIHEMFCISSDAFPDVCNLNITMDGKFDDASVKQAVKSEGFVFIS